FLAFEEDFPLPWLNHAGYRVQDGGLATAVAADQADQIPLANFQRDVKDHLECAIAKVDILDLQYNFIFIAHDSIRPQIGFDHPLIADDLGCGAFRNPVAASQHNHVVRQLDDSFHDVFHHHDGHTFRRQTAQEVDHLFRSEEHTSEL